MPVYAIREQWMITETRYYTAKNKKEAMAKSGSMDYDRVGDDLHFEEYLGIEKIDKYGI